jgi:hypothetical protein
MRKNWLSVGGCALLSADCSCEVDRMAESRSGLVSGLCCLLLDHICCSPPLKAACIWTDGFWQATLTAVLITSSHDVSILLGHDCSGPPLWLTWPSDHMMMCIGVPAALQLPTSMSTCDSFAWVLDIYQLRCQLHGV